MAPPLRFERTAIFQVSGSKNHSFNSSEDQKPQMLGTWNLWAQEAVGCLEREREVQDCPNKMFSEPFLSELQALSLIRVQVPKYETFPPNQHDDSSYRTP